MPFPFGAVIGAGAGLLGGAMSNQASARSVGRQLEFQERMSSTSYQRAVEDMRRAGLNPALAYQQGGASSPGGASYTAQNIGESGARAGSAGASASAIDRQTRADVALKEATANKAQAEAMQIGLESALRVKSLEAGVKATSAQTTLTDRTSLLRELELSLMSATWEAQVETGRMRPQELRERIELLRRQQSQLSADELLKRVQGRLTELGIPRARNLADQESTRFKRDFSPFISDAKSLADIVKMLVPGI